MTDDDIRAHVMKAEGVLDQIQDKVTSQFGDARKAIMAIDRAYSQLLSSRDFYREARNELITDRDHWEHEAKEAQRNFKSMQSQSNQLRDEVLEQSQIIGDLKAENAELRAQRDQTQEVADQAMAMQNSLTLDNISLRAGQGSWPTDKPDDFPCCTGERVPRAITADQIRPEQLIAYWQEGVRPNPFGKVAHVRTVEMEDDGSYCVADPEGRFDFLGGDVDCTIVLLADAPEPERDAPPRLTVHALNTAPVGSEVVCGAEAALKRLDGFWGIGIFWPSISAEDLMERIVEAGGVDDATLHHPERGDHG